MDLPPAATMFLLLRGESVNPVAAGRRSHPRIRPSWSISRGWSNPRRGAIRCSFWWRTMRRKRHPNAKRLMITADGGGSNGYRVRLWKVELQKLSDELKLPITVCHLPPGTSKWNKIEHRLFSFISINWRGKPLRSFRTIVQLIAATTTETGLKVRAEWDENKYPKGIKVSDAKINALNLSRHSFHGDWNYTVSPTKKIPRKKTN